jgi:hypothetical protein
MRQHSLFDNKIKSRLYGEEFKEASRQKIIAQVEMYNSDETALFWEALRAIKKEFIEEHLRLDFSHFIFPSFESTQLTGGGIPKKARESFNFWEEGESVSFNQELSFKKCYFTDDVNFQSTLFKKTTTFFGTQFRKESEFYHTTFLKDVRFDEAGFHGRTVFHKTSFKGKSSFSILNSKYRITFFSCHSKHISFKYSRIENAYFIKNQFDYLNLHGVAIQTPFFSDNNIHEAERETFAYIKQFFDEKKDYISANHYYVQEMNAYQKELFPESTLPFFKKIYHWLNKPNLGDKLVFGFTKLASDFGQNLFLPLYWILFVGFLFVGLYEKGSIIFMLLSTALFLSLTLFTFFIKRFFKISKTQPIKSFLRKATFSFAFTGILIHGWNYIDQFAKVINPIRFLRTQGGYCNEVAFICLLLRVFVAVMVYHFITSVKRSIKR